MNQNGYFCRTLMAAIFISTPSLRASETTKVAAIVEAAATAFVSDPQSVGISIGVLREGHSETFHYGTTRRGEQRPPTDETLYPIASITKTFTGSLLALAAVEKKLNLEDDVRSHLGGDFPNLEFGGQPIRLRDLLNHRSGLPFLLPDRPELMPGYNGEPIEQHLARLDQALSGYTRADFYADLRAVKLKAVPGHEFRYSNAAAQLGGYILEDIYGKSFEQCVASKICDPLNLTSTTITVSASQRHQLATGYDGEGKAMPFPVDALQGAGALKSTVADLLKYARWHLAEGDEVVRLSHQPTFTENNYAAGLNWQILTADHRRLIWQEGNVPRFTSYLLFEPELRLGLVVLTNESDRTSSARIAVLANTILKALDGQSVPLP